MKMTPYYRALNNMLDDIFQAWDGTMAELAKESGLCYQTVLNINTRWTEYPRFKTVFLLAKAVGMELRLIKMVKERKRA